MAKILDWNAAKGNINLVDTLPLTVSGAELKNYKN
jgi:hypothetical protein